MRKTYLLDTNILMHYPNAIFGFQDNIVAISSVTVEELDNLKTAYGETGLQARSALRYIDKLRRLADKQKAFLSEGIAINNNTGIFKIIPYHSRNVDMDFMYDISKADNKILECAKSLNAIIISEDRGVCIKADSLGIKVEEYKNVSMPDDIKNNRHTLYVPAEIIDAIYIDGIYHISDDIKKEFFQNEEVYDNEYCILHDISTDSHVALCRYYNNTFKKLIEMSDVRGCKIRPLNIGQKCAFDALMSDDVHLVILKGQAGTAKTFLSTVAGMQGLHEKWDRIVATRNNIEFDKEIGALPGDELDKVGPLLRGLTDNLRTYFKLQGTEDSLIDTSIEDYLARGDISIESMSFMRGRSITDSFLIVDECQNATIKQIIGIVTRAGRGTKVVLCGDPDQIDNIKLDKKNCGLTFASERMKNSSYSSIITFTDEECERSDLAKDAILRMKL